MEPKKEEMSETLKQILFDAVVKHNSAHVNEIMKRFHLTDELRDLNGDTLIAIATKYDD